MYHVSSIHHTGPQKSAYRWILFFPGEFQLLLQNLNHTRFEVAVCGAHMEGTLSAYGWVPEGFIRFFQRWIFF